MKVIGTQNSNLAYKIYIMDDRCDMAILSARFFGELVYTLGDFLIQSSTWQVEVISGSTSFHHIPQRYSTQSTHCLSNGQCKFFMREEGCSVKFR